MIQRAYGLPWPSFDSPRRRESGLLERAVEGDREAFDRLVSAYRVEVRRFVIRRVGDQAADDVLQEIFLGAWRSLRNFDRRSQVKTWLFAIAINKCRDWVDDQRRRRSFVSPERHLEVLPARDLLSAADARHDVHAFLADLPSEQRDVLELYYFGELTLKEIGEALEVNLNTVKYRFYRAHEVAAQRLGD